MGYDGDFDGADADALAMLGGGVAGTDFVGAVNPMLHGMFAKPAQRTGMLAPQAAATLMQTGMNAIRFTQKIQKERKLRQLALAGAIPQVMLPCSTAAGADVAGGATVTLTATPGVPMRITKYTVATSIAQFFAVLSITAARMNMIAGSGGRVPAENFLSDNTCPPIENPMLGAGSPIAVIIENLDPANKRYVSNFWGVDLTPATARIV